MKDNDPSRDPYLTAFTDVNAAVFVVRELVGEAEIRVERELLARIARSNEPFICERCSELVWVELAEGGRPILVEGDGTPHEDNCRPQQELFEAPNEASGEEKSHDEPGN